MPASEQENPDRPTCPMCGRKARSGIRCAQTYCPYALSVNKQGYVVLSRPLRQRIN